MDLKKILSISGKPGLYRMIAQTKTGLIVESLSDNKRIPTHLTDKVNNLEDITVYMNEKDLPLKDVLLKIFSREKGGSSIDHKSDDKTLKAYFEEIFPDYNREKVYASDIKKIINWYNILQMLELIKPDDEKPNEEAKPDAEEKNESTS